MTTNETTGDSSVLRDTRGVRLEDLLQDEAIAVAQERALDDQTVSAAAFNSGI